MKVAFSKQFFEVFRNEFESDPLSESEIRYIRKLDIYISLKPLRDRSDATLGFSDDAEEIKISSVMYYELYRIKIDGVLFYCYHGTVFE